jgi:hypothetical protein
MRASGLPAQVKGRVGWWLPLRLLPPQQVARRSQPRTRSHPGTLYVPAITDADCIRKPTPVHACPCEIRISWTNASQVTSRCRSSPLRCPKERTPSHHHAPSELSLSSIVAF